MSQPNAARLVFIVSSFEPDVGGDVRLVANQARALADRGWDVTILTRRPEAAVPRQERIGGLSVVRRGRRGGRRWDHFAALLGWTLWLIRRRRDVAAVHVVMHPDYLVPPLASGLLDRSVLQWITDGDVARSLGWRGGGLRALQIRVRRWLTARALNVSLTKRMSLELDDVGVSPGEIIPLAVDTNRFQPPDGEARQAERARHDAGADEMVILFVGHLEPRKGVDRLIRAVATLPESRRWRLLLVGDDHPGQTYRHDLEQLVAQLGLQARVSFVGVVHDVESYFRIADVFAIASDREGLPNVLLEAMAHGVACVAPASAGGDELLAGGAGGVPASNRPEDMASELRVLLEDAALREQFGRRARARVERYSLDAVARSYEQVYVQLGHGAAAGRSPRLPHRT